jgi:hypothetical protein
MEAYETGVKKLAEMELRFLLITNMRTLITKALALNLSLAWRSWVLVAAGDNAITFRLVYAFGSTFVAVEVGRMLAFLQPEQDFKFFIGDENENLSEKVKAEIKGRPL